MSVKDSIDVLSKMTNYYVEIEQFTAGMTVVDFHNDIKTVRAVTNNILQIGELSKKLDSDFRKRYNTNIDWAELRLTRNLIAHDSESISHKRLWDTAKYDLSRVFGIIRILLYELNREINPPKPRGVGKSKSKVTTNTNSNNSSKSKNNVSVSPNPKKKPVQKRPNTTVNNVNTDTTTNDSVMNKQSNFDYKNEDYGFKDKGRHKNIGNSGSNGNNIATKKRFWK